jgi:16S rRNA (guanine527-N7)-methyltransferase
MPKFSDEQIKNSLSDYWTSASSELCAKVRAYISILTHWNKTISLTNITDPVEILRFHFGESLFAVSNVPISDGRLADVGSGPGFPGLPLKLAVPSLSVVLIESNGRKAAFLCDVIRELKLDHAEVFHGRMENFSKENSIFDFVTARALGQTDELLSWARCELVPSGRLVLWLGKEDSAKIGQDEAWNWRDPIHIPGSRRRNLLIGAPRS